MTTNELKERITELCAKEDFVQKLESAETREDLLALLKENGIEEEPENILAVLPTEENGEIKDAELENVAGGMFLPPLNPGPLPRPFPVPLPRTWPWLGRKLYDLLNKR